MIDFFVSHSREIKSIIAIPIVQYLTFIGFDVWIDRNSIVSGDHIYKKIEDAIDNSKFGIILIDEVYLNRFWTIKEIELFHKREVKENKVLIIPIFIGIEKKEVYKTIPWLEGRAFEKLDKTIFNKKDNIDIICRIISKYFSKNLKTNTLDRLVKSVNIKNFLCANTLYTIVSSKQYLSEDIRLASIELCNIINLIHAIYLSLNIEHINNDIIIPYQFSKSIQEYIFSELKVSYNMYISIYNLTLVSCETLYIILNDFKYI